MRLQKSAIITPQEDIAAKPQIYSYQLEELVWLNDTDQNNLLPSVAQNQWMPAFSSHESPPIWRSDEAQQNLASWDLPGQATSSPAVGFGPLHEESQENGYEGQTPYPFLGEHLDVAVPQIGDQSFGCIPEMAQAQSGLADSILGAHFSSMTSVDTPSSAVLDRIQQNPASSKRESSKKPKIKKPRISCTYPACKLTFPRPYELQRHLDNFHKRIIIPCIVYGCNRIARPVPRADKFREHMRKHANAHTFVCAVEGCPAGPFDRDQLCQHLNTTHNMTSYGEEVVVKERLRGISLRMTPQEDGSRFVEDWVNCPLSFLGCTFRAIHLDAFSWHHFIHEAHIKTHDLSERSKGYEAIRESGFDFHGVARGVATCPICQKLVCKEDNYLGMFLIHLEKHTKEQRNPHIVELWECIRPFSFYRAWHQVPMIQNEYQEATGVSTLKEN
ncbi:uncharacterized protein PAC_05454 [Phialocephala subalpina]|uniref:C2H2-type domain-containing protein n=1 Tax=Phialocephala subalpina TaxID=576137 RepID=A0A1L7WS11_9HELO|nr:uncharacterized protein PAC_05454 [Phialocephala subalpina]